MILLKILAVLKGIGFSALMVGIILVILGEDNPNGEDIKYNGDVSDGDENNALSMTQKIRKKYAPAVIVVMLIILEILIDGGFILLAK